MCTVYVTELFEQYSSKADPQFYPVAVQLIYKKSAVCLDFRIVIRHLSQSYQLQCYAKGRKGKVTEGHLF